MPKEPGKIHHISNSRIVRNLVQPPEAICGSCFQTDQDYASKKTCQGRISTKMLEAILKEDKKLEDYTFFQFFVVITFF